MNQEKDDPHDVIYDGNGSIRIYTKRDQYNELYYSYLKRLNMEAAALEEYLTSTYIDSSILENHKNKIMLYTNIIKLLDMSLANDKVFTNHYVEKTIYSACEIFNEESEDYSKVAKQTNKKTLRIIKKYK